MPRRIHICPVDGTGTDSDPFRARTYGRDHSTLGISPGIGYAVCVVDAVDHAPLDADAAIDSFPLRMLATPLSELTAAQRTRLQSMAARRGISLVGASNLREVVLRLAKRIDPDFDTRAWRE